VSSKDATDEALQIEADKEYYACLPHAADSGVRLAILKRGMAIERARLIDEVKMWSATREGMPYHIHNELCEMLNGLLIEIEAK